MTPALTQSITPRFGLNLRVWIRGLFSPNDVLQSEMISSHVGDSSLSGRLLPLVEKLSLKVTRKESADEDIRRLA